jgi:hypothetical protein
MIRRFSNTDYGVSHAISNTRRRGRELSPQQIAFIAFVDRVLSYDIDCGYSIYTLDRFEEQFPEDVDFIAGMRWLIPLLHVQNHRDNCTYLFSSAYVESVGHFHGETAEQTWIELNQLAGQTRQMNNGHRQDTIIDHHSYWNWSKTAIMGKY